MHGNPTLSGSNSLEGVHMYSPKTTLSEPTPSIFAQPTSPPFLSMAVPYSR